MARLRTARMPKLASIPQLSFEDSLVFASSPDYGVLTASIICVNPPGADRIMHVQLHCILFAPQSNFGERLGIPDTSIRFRNVLEPNDIDRDVQASFFPNQELYLPRS